MVNFLFGSSNVYRNYSRALSLGLFAGRDLQLVKCTKKIVLDAHLATLTSAGLIVLSVLENFITEVCADVTDEEVNLFARQQVTALVDKLYSVTQRIQGVNIVIMPPMFRSNPPWFGSYLPDLSSFLVSEVARVGTNQIAVCTPFVVVPSMLEADGVHLSAAGGERFLTHLDGELRTLLIEVESLPQQQGQQQPHDRLDQILDVVSRNSSQLESFRAINETVIDLSRSTTNFESFVRRRFKDDDLIFARMKEESDAEINRTREDRVVITGLAGTGVHVSTHAEKKKHYSDLVGRLVTLSCASAEVQPQVVDVYINLRKERGQPLVEVRFDSVKGAQLFRTEGVRLAKAQHAEFQTLFFANSVTQSTRVRIEILRELSKKLCSTTEVAFVQGFISRPVLQYRVKEGARSRADGVGRSYTFVDAMAKFGTKLAQKDLGKAYARAGNTFDGALSQYFVVLVDNHNGERTRSGANRTPVGRRGGRGSRGRGGNTFRLALQSGPSHDRGLKRSADMTEVGDEEESVAGASKRQEKDDEGDADITLTFDE